MKHKNAEAAITAPDPDTGTFEAIVSVFNNVDMAGDVVRPGAFKKSIEHWANSGDSIPVYWSHQLSDPTMNIGAVLDIAELPGGDKSIPDWANPWVKEHGGLYVKAQLDDFGMGAHVRHLLKTRRVKQFSYTYDVLREQKNKSGDNELLDLFVHEVGPTPLGCNPLTELIGAKKAPDEPDPPPDDDRDVESKAAVQRRLFYFFKKAEIAAIFAKNAD